MEEPLKEAAERIERIGNLLLFRRELLQLGEMSLQTVRRMLELGEAVPIAQGVYMRAGAWQSLFPGEKLLAKTLGHAKLNASRGWVFTHESAAAIWNLPLWNLRSLRVHIATSEHSPTRSSAPVMRHLCTLGNDEVIEQSGLRFTSLTRTVVDLALRAPQELAIGVADAGLRLLHPGSRGESSAAAEDWKHEQSEMLMLTSRPGVRNARTVIAMADPRADSVLESVSRLQLERLGVAYEMQVAVETQRGGTYWIDFEFLEQDVFGEVDGNVKYFDRDMRGHVSAEEVLRAEKTREDDIRGLTGKRIVRWQAEHLTSARKLGDRLARFGVRVPGWSD